VNFFPTDIELSLFSMTVFAVGTLLAYALIRAAVVGALRDHHKWVERRDAKTFKPVLTQSSDLPFGHRP
jgi:hypothetical protein